MGACGRLRESAVVLAMVVIVVIVLAVSGLAFYAMHRSKPSRLKLSASLFKLASFSIEVDSADDRDSMKQLPPASGTVSQPQAEDEGSRSPRHRKRQGPHF
jgi:hypothetical protein